MKPIEVMADNWERKFKETWGTQYSQEQIDSFRNQYTGYQQSLRNAIEASLVYLNGLQVPVGLRPQAYALISKFWYGNNQLGLNSTILKNYCQALFDYWRSMNGWELGDPVDLAIISIGTNVFGVTLT